MVKLRRIRIFFLIVTVILFLALQMPAMASNTLVISTATTGGTYYPVGVAIATLISIKHAAADDIMANAITSAGSAENIERLRDQESDLAILQGLFAAQAYHGRGRYENAPMKKMAGITMLWDNVEHFALLNSYLKTGTIMDLKELNEGFSLGPLDSGSEGSGRVILEALGIEPGTDFSIAYLSYNSSIDGMQDGRVVGANIPAGIPVSAIVQMYSMLGERVTVLDFTEEQRAAVNSDFDLWRRFTIPAGTYPGQSRPINTIAQPNILAAAATLDDEVVYKITRTIYENLPFLNNIHHATKALDINEAIEGMPMPLHPGASRYYREVGIEIPDHLLSH